VLAEVLHARDVYRRSYLGSNLSGDPPHGEVRLLAGGWLGAECPHRPLIKSSMCTPRSMDSMGRSEVSLEQHALNVLDADGVAVALVADTQLTVFPSEHELEER
jgi:hypothetical protein